MLYTHQGKYPSILPDRIRLSNGATRTDPSTFTPEEIADAGYVAVSNKPVYDIRTELVGFSGSSWAVRSMTPEELEAASTAAWAEVRYTRDKMINTVAWRIERYHSHTRLGIDPVDDIAALDLYVQALRDVTTQEDPYNIIWPELVAGEQNNQ